MAVTSQSRRLRGVCHSGATLIGLALLGALLATPAYGFGPSDRKLEAWVHKHSKKVFPKPADRKIDQIAWVPTLGQALDLAAQHRRPVFLFRFDGNIDTGRT